MTNVVQLHALCVEDFPREGIVVRVARLDCETFEVELFRKVPKHPRDERYIVRNRTHFVGGQRLARSLNEVRNIIRRA